MIRSHKEILTEDAVGSFPKFEQRLDQEGGQGTSAKSMSGSMARKPELHVESGSA